MPAPRRQAADQPHLLLVPGHIDPLLVSAELEAPGHQEAVPLVHALLQAAVGVGDNAQLELCA